MTAVHAWNDVRIYEKEAQSLAQFGHQVVIVGPDGQCCGVSNGNQVRHVPVRLPGGRLARMTAGALKILGRTLAARARVCHFHDPELLPVGLALKALGQRVVYDVHEDYPEQILSKHYLPGWLRQTVARAFGRVEKLAARCFDGVVAATDGIAGKFAGAKVVTVRNYPKTGGVHRRQVEDLHPAGATRPFRICHLAGTLTEERGITSLVRAMEELGDGFELVLAGRFVPAEYESSLRGMAGFGRVRYLGVMPHEEAWHWYGQSDVGAVCLLPVPRFETSLPVKLFEFMAAGLPVVASDFALFRQIVEGNNCGICVNPERPEEIAAAVRQLAADQVARRRMGAAGLAAVRSKYRWEVEAETLARFYQEIGR